MKNVFWMCLAVLVLAAAGAYAGGQEVVRFAFQDRIGSVVPIVAVAKAFFAQQGLRVEPLRFSSGPACAEALYSGAADIGCMGDTTAVIMTSRSPDFVIIASHASGEHRHRVMVRADAPLKTLADLRGKRLGVKKGTSTYGGLLAALDKAGVAPSEVRIIDLTPGTMLDALLAGSIDAFAASEPTPSAAEEKGARQLCTLGGLGNTYPILTLANTTHFAGNESALRKFLLAMGQAAAYAKAHPEETAELMARETGLPLARAKRAMQLHSYDLALDQAIRTSLDKTARFLLAQQIIETLPNWPQAATDQYLP